MLFSLPVKNEWETVDGIAYTTTWVGNQVIDIIDVQSHGNVSPLPF